MRLFLSSPERQPEDLVETIREAVDNDQVHGWSRRGIYCFWENWEANVRFHIEAGAVYVKLVILEANKEQPKMNSYRMYFEPVIVTLLSHFPNEISTINIDYEPVPELPE